MVMVSFSKLSSVMTEIWKIGMGVKVIAQISLFFAVMGFRIKMKVVMMEIQQVGMVATIFVVSRFAEMAFYSQTKHVMTETQKTVMGVTVFVT